MKLMVQVNTDNNRQDLRKVNSMEKPPHQKSITNKVGVFFLLSKVKCNVLSFDPLLFSGRELCRNMLKNQDQISSLVILLCYQRIFSVCTRVLWGVQSHVFYSLSS